MRQSESPGRTRYVSAPCTSTVAARPCSRAREPRTSAPPLRVRRSGSAFAGWRPPTPCRELDCARCPASGPAELAEERCAPALEERSLPGEEEARRWGLAAKGGGP